VQGKSHTRLEFSDGVSTFRCYMTRIAHT